ncbi:MAG: DHA2 family efflux MFS transporter permease subunit [Streptomyces sp.]|uniref:MFS transporter n=1 Tax=Streptomyces sp. TaxID=1931 RepID=UPI0025F7FE6F|nr:MFS transporter [Streptomyces sp.]MBW8795151.1 DHA2 family efflux MFS transporter permease subunit [Streptomyces sp.]
MSSASVGSVDAHAGVAPAQSSSAHGARHQAPHRWMVLAVIGLAQLMVVLDSTIVNIALPSAQHDLGFSNDGRQWVVTAYSLAFGSLLLLGGRLADFFGRKTTLLIGLIGFAGASAMAGASQNLTMLIVGRAVQGVFGALLAPAALSLLTTTFTDAKERAKAFGVYGAIAGSGGAIGLLLGGLLTEHLNWRYTLYVNLPIAVVAVIGTVVFVRRPAKAQRPRLDTLGTVLAAGGMFSLVYGFANAETHPWGNWMVWAFLAAGGVLLALFTFWETRTGHPLLPLRVLADRNRAAAYLSVFVTGAGMFGIFLFLTYYLQETLHYSPVKTGLAFLPMIGALMVFAQLATIVAVPRIGAKPIVPVGALLAAAGMVWLTRLDLHSAYTSDVLGPLLIMGAGIGMVMPPAMSLATLGVAPQDQGVASATTNTMQQVGGSIGTALFSTLAATSATDYVRDHQPVTSLVKANAALHSYATAYWWAAGFFVVAAVLAAVLYRKGSPTAQAQTVDSAPRAAFEEHGATGTEAVPLVQPRTATGMDRPDPDGLLVSGRVLAAGGGVPAPGAVVTLIDPTGRQLGHAVADAAGHYAVAVPAPGPYVLVGSAAGRQPQVATLTVGGSPVEYNLVLAGTTGLTGSVRSGGLPVAGALVVATDVFGEVADSTVTGADGGYRLGELVAGEYVLTVSAEGHRPTAVAVTVGDTGAAQDILLAPAAAVRGTVRGRNGSPLTDARVALLDSAGNVVAARTTGEDGEYAFPDLPGTEYTVVASGYPPVAAPLRLDGAGRDGFDLYLTHEETGQEGTRQTGPLG